MITEDEREFNYEQGSERGPTRWGEIRPEWSTCSNGTMQSPIDLLDQRVEVVSKLERIKTNYKPSNATLKNRGHDMMLKWKSGDAGYIEINGTQYLLQQCHWHSLSEHTINGNKFDLELHAVHESQTGEVVVIGIIYQIGESDSFLSSIEDHLDAVSDTEEQTVIGAVDPKKIRIGSRRYYKYIGSLTVPPCTQNVVWIIAKQVRTVTKEQVSHLRVAVHDDSDTNARPTQQINGRSVKLYSEEEENEDD
ncbi:Carbonic anhydrase, alpha-class [Parasponia andersonii]|uniref:Carbonic anhydrase n=1 Tax=Parasponia andersonii TaxID=3476 RepID=A0A2P5B1D9_PARAD|nr:Carbonic anhydrase, alpha-class [Parasponia andersonii]